MKQKIKILIFIIPFIIVLTVLFLLSSTNLILKENQNKIYNISIIVSDTGDERWQNYKKGVTAAADRLNADISFITLYNWQTAAEKQQQAIEREIQNGANAIVLFAADTTAAQEYIDNMSYNIPIIALGVQIESSKINAQVLYDYAKIGTSLADAAINDLTAEKLQSSNIVVVSSTLLQQADDIIIENLKTNLPQNITLSKQTVLSSETAKYLLSNLPKDTQTVVFALDAEALRMIAETVKQIQNKNIYLYGVGPGDSVISYLEEGFINAAVCSNDYLAGYISIQNAVQLADKNKPIETYIPEVQTVTYKNMFTPEIEQLIFPIV